MGRIPDARRVVSLETVTALQNDNAALRRLAALLWTAFEHHCTRYGDDETYDAMRARAIALGVPIEGEESWQMGESAR